MRNLKSIPLLALPLALILCACFNPGSTCTDTTGFGFNNALQFSIYENETHRDVLLVYNPDTLAVYDEDWVKLDDDPEWTTYNGEFLIVPDIAKDKGVYNQRISRNFYVYFNHLDTDTISVEFVLNERTDECHNDLLSDLKVSYNDSVYYDQHYGAFEWMRFYKK